MIKANELRIGNWLKYRNGSFIRVESITEKSLNIIFNEGSQCGVHFDMPPYIMQDDLKDFEPVQLTEELLLKIGFNKDEDGWLSINCKENSLGINLTDGKWQFYWFNNTPLDYLHQLQNLYFALTGQELEIELC